MFMFNECHIHLCDCTWLNVFSHAQYLLIKHKKIFECFSCFWKVSCFYKNVKNFKNSVALSWRLNRRLVQSHVPVTSLHRDFSWLTSGLKPQSRKILRIFFTNWFLMFLVTQSSDLFAGGRSSCEGYTRIFMAQIATLSRVELPVAKNI